MRFLLPAACSLVLLYACGTQKQIAPSEVTEEVLMDTVYVSAPSPEAQREVAMERPVYNPEAETEFDLVHTRLDVSFNWEKQWVIGKAHVQLSPRFYPDSILKLDAKNFDVQSIFAADDNRSLTYEYDNRVLHIELAKVYRASDTFGIVIDYIAKPAEEETGGSAAIRSAQGLFFINHLGTEPGKPMQIWTQGETEHNSRWFPTIDKPNQRSSQEIILTVDDRFTTLSNGLLVSSEMIEGNKRRDHWKMDQSHAPYLFMIAVGEYAVVKEEWEDMEVSYYVEPAYKRFGAEIFDHTPEMLTYFRDLLNFEYPWDKYAQVVVRDYVSGAMENTTASVFGEFVQKEKGDLVDNPNDAIVAHELMHQWFGDLVTCESWANLTLNEGFANYAEYLWQEYKNGKTAAEFSRLNEYYGYLQETRRKIHPLIHYGYDDKEDMFDAHSYNKGGLVLHMLRNWIGDDAFFASLRKYLESNRFEAVEADELRLAIEEVTGRDMNWFFNDWFFGAGHPVVEVRHRWNRVDKTVKLHLEQVQDPDESVPVFRMPYTVEVFYSNGDSKRHEIVLDRRKQEFILPAREEPRWVNVDADKVTLSVFNNVEASDPAFVFEHATNFLDRQSAFASMMQSGEVTDSATIASILSEDFWYFRYLTLNLLTNMGNTRHTDKIKDMGLLDPEPAVRELAYEYFRANPELISADQPMQTLRMDSSYSAKMAALGLLFDLQNEAAWSIADTFEKSLSTTVQLNLADFYATYDEKGEKLGYYAVHWEKASGFASPRYFEYWATAVMRDSGEHLPDVTGIWTGIAADENRSRWSRLGALNALKYCLNELDSQSARDEADFDKIRMLGAKISEIEDNIEDERLIRMIERWENRRSGR